MDDEIHQYTGAASRLALRIDGGCDFRPIYPFMQGQEMEPIGSECEGIVIMIDQMMPIGKGEIVIGWVLHALSALGVLALVRRVVLCSGSATTSDAAVFTASVQEVYAAHGQTAPEVLSLRKPFDLTKLREVVEV